MQIENPNPLELYFQQVARNAFVGKLGLRDEAANNYVAHVLCEVSEAEKLFRLRDKSGRPIEIVSQMLIEADPIHGNAPSFEVERAVRKHIGDYALFTVGMYPEIVESRRRDGMALQELAVVGIESYSIVSKFNVFEYAKEAPLFERLSRDFGHYVEGLQLVRKELDLHKSPPTPPGSH